MTETCPTFTALPCSDAFTATASVETVTGTRRVDCAAAWISDDTATSTDAGPVSGTLHCRLPQRVETAPGLRATLAVEGTTLGGATLVPNVFVGYDDTADTYTVRLDDGSGPRTVPVTVGLTDGLMRAILTDVPVGATLLLPQEARGD